MRALKSHGLLLRETTKSHQASSLSVWRHSSFSSSHTISILASRLFLENINIILYYYCAQPRTLHFFFFANQVLKYIFSINILIHTLFVCVSRDSCHEHVERVFKIRGFLSIAMSCDKCRYRWEPVRRVVKSRKKNQVWTLQLCVLLWEIIRIHHTVRLCNQISNIFNWLLVWIRVLCHDATKSDLSLISLVQSGFPTLVFPLLVVSTIQHNNYVWNSWISNVVYS